MANYCNKICHDYYCEMNAKGRCHAPNPCLGYEEAAELISELKAAKREIAALRKRERGDVAKLREAALRQKELLQTIYSRGSVDRRELCAGMGLIDAALAAPPRNCDVGTIEEQSERKIKFCHNQRGCANCPFSESTTLTLCALAWAQMPYEEGGAK